MSTLYDLNWGQKLAGQITNQVENEIKSVCRVRPLIPMVTEEMAYAKTVPDTTVTALAAGVAMNPARTLAPIKLSRPFVVRPEQFDDLETISRLALNAGYDVAAAEDDVLLFGNAAVGLQATDESGTLGDQRGLLLAVPGGMLTPVDESILNAITRLRNNRHYGPFCVVLSPTLHLEAFSPIAGTAVPVISPILPQLRQDGVQFSPSLGGRSGVVFSVGKAAIDLVIPWDIHVECREVRGDATFVVIEQFRLRINDRYACVVLGTDLIVSSPPD